MPVVVVHSPTPPASALALTAETPAGPLATPPREIVVDCGLDAVPREALLASHWSASLERVHTPDSEGVELCKVLVRSVEEQWRALADAHDEALEARAKKKVVELLDLDRWWRSTLPGVLDKAREITLEELSRVTKWKLARNKFRPRLQSLVDGNDDARVREASRAAFVCVDKGNLTGAIDELCVLSGVGPATATAVLAAYRPDRVPFLADDAIAAVVPSAGNKYTKQTFELLEARLSEWVHVLGGDWTLSRVEMALYAQRLLGR